MKAADIPDDLVYEAVAAARWAGPDNRPAPLMIWDAFTALSRFPEKVVFAKLRQMVAKGRLRGCPCGCRGDFRFPWEEFGGDYTGRENWRERLAEYLKGEREYGY